MTKKNNNYSVNLSEIELILRQLFEEYTNPIHERFDSLEVAINYLKESFDTFLRSIDKEKSSINEDSSEANKEAKGILETFKNRIGKITNPEFDSKKQEILNELNGKATASHKLKLTVPLIPLFLKYEGEINFSASESFNSWRDLKRIFIKRGRNNDASKNKETITEEERKRKEEEKEKENKDWEKAISKMDVVTFENFKRRYIHNTQKVNMANVFIEIIGEWDMMIQNLEKVINIYTANRNSIKEFLQKKSEYLKKLKKKAEKFTSDDEINEFLSEMRNSFDAIEMIPELPAAIDKNELIKISYNGNELHVCKEPIKIETFKIYCRTINQDWLDKIGKKDDDTNIAVFTSWIDAVKLADELTNEFGLTTFNHRTKIDSLDNIKADGFRLPTSDELKFILGHSDVISYNEINEWCYDYDKEKFEDEYYENDNSQRMSISKRNVTTDENSNDETQTMEEFLYSSQQEIEENQALTFRLLRPQK